MPGLTKKKVTVRTKRGKVYQRSMNVRSQDSQTRHRIAQTFMRHGITNAGMGLGALAGGWHHNALALGGGAMAGGLAGHQIGKHAARSRLSTRAKFAIGAIGHLAGVASAGYNLHRQLKHGTSVMQRLDAARSALRNEQHQKRTEHVDTVMRSVVAAANAPVRRKKRK